MADNRNAINDELRLNRRHLQTFVSGKELRKTAKQPAIIPWPTCNQDFSS